MTIVKLLSSSFVFLQLADSMPLHNEKSSKNIHINSSITMTPSEDTSIVDFPIASTRLRSHSKKAYVNVIYPAYTREKGRPTFDTNDPLKHVSNIPDQQNTM